ncbi:MAG: class I SAM-dependent methyltransferase [Gemmatimonadetes bacterium]|nr:class I SAM-dependent methyltransferase [Gemmatimonadota bacterium]
MTRGNTASPDQPGRCSARWFGVFLDRVPQDRTDAEIAFLRSLLPLPDYRKVLDVCCGPGRHAGPLARHGHDLTGVDIDPHAIERARAKDPRGRYLVMDARDLDFSDDPHDAVLCMWASFGWFDEQTNFDVLERMTAALRTRGQLVLDVYHRGFFGRTPYERVRDEDGTRIVESVRLDGHRLTVRLRYLPSRTGKDTRDPIVADSTQSEEIFQWNVYTPEELIASCRRFGLRSLVSCSGFDPLRPPSAAVPRMQLVFRKDGAGP